MEINILQVLFQIINFGVVFGALTFLLYKPILKILDERRTKAEEAHLIAEEAAKQKEEVETMKKKAKVTAEKDAAKILEKADDEAKTLHNKLSKEVREEIKALRVKELAKLSEEVKGNRVAMEKQITSTAVAVASKVLGKELSDKKVEAAILSDSIHQLDEALSSL